MRKPEANKYMERCSTSLVNTKMHITTTTIYYMLYSHQIGKNFSLEISKVGCGIIETLFTIGALENNMCLAKLNNEFYSLAYVLDINMSKKIYCRINKLNCYMILLCCIAYVFKVSLFLLNV